VSVQGTGGSRDSGLAIYSSEKSKSKIAFHIASYSSAIEACVKVTGMNINAHHMAGKNMDVPDAVNIMDIMPLTIFLV